MMWNNKENITRERRRLHFTGVCEGRIIRSMKVVSGAEIRANSREESHLTGCRLCVQQSVTY